MKVGLPRYKISEILTLFIKEMMNALKNLYFKTEFRPESLIFDPSTIDLKNDCIKNLFIHF